MPHTPIKFPSVEIIRTKRWCSLRVTDKWKGNIVDQRIDGRPIKKKAKMTEALKIENNKILGAQKSKK